MNKANKNSKRFNGILSFFLPFPLEFLHVSRSSYQTCHHPAEKPSMLSRIKRLRPHIRAVCQPITSHAFPLCPRHDAFSREAAPFNTFRLFVRHVALRYQKQKAVKCDSQRVRRIM
jgi:hypothetical protein